MRICCLAALVVLIWAEPALGWKYVEHAEIGTEGYKKACKRVRARLAGAESAATERFAIACANLTVRAGLYGQATALAGDRLDKPEDFLARGGDWKVGSSKHYYILQLVDVHHYHPAALREWEKHHREALTYATTARTKKGIDLVHQFRRVFYRNAFADHFLHDAYAAGHMGFNRSASSIAATQAYHDSWNRRGRRVRDRMGRTWIAYGDGLLNRKAHRQGRARVISAAAASTYAALAAFVFGARDHAAELETWRQLPFLIDARATPSLLGFDEDGLTQQASLKQLRPLQSVNWPARVDTELDAALTLLGVRGTLAEPTLALLAGFDVALPLLGTRTHVSIGATTPSDDFSVRFAAQAELRRELAMSWDGLLVHQVSAGFLWEARRSFAGFARGVYTLRAEAGLHLFKLEIGPAYDVDNRKLGYSFGIGYGRALGVSGGGVR